MPEISNCYGCRVWFWPITMKVGMGIPTKGDENVIHKQKHTY